MIQHTFLRLEVMQEIEVDAAAGKVKSGRSLSRREIWIPKVNEFVDVLFDSDKKFEPQK